MGGEFPTSGFSDALVILGAAGIVIPTFARLKITPVIGFILVGVITGPFALGALARHYPALHLLSISDPQRIEPFAELGIILLLFSAGLHINFRRLSSMRGPVFGVGSAELIGCAVAGFRTSRVAMALTRARTASRARSRSRPCRRATARSWRS